MKSDLQRITNFIDKHHVMSLASSRGDELSVCNLFYVYDADELSFVVASSEETTHIQNVLNHPNIAGSVVLETKNIGKIQGIQFQGEFLLLEDKKLSNLYFKTFPHALVMKPKLWQIKVNYFKMTDNTLGFGKKIIWQEPSA